MTTDDQPLPPSSPDGEPGSRAELDALFLRIAEETIAHPPGWRDRLREMPTPGRAALVALGIAAVAIIPVLVIGPRQDLDDSGWLGLALLSAPAVVGVVLATGLGLRGLHRPPPGYVIYMIVAVAVGLPVLLTLVVEHLPGKSGSSESMKGCALVGVVVGLLAIGVFRIFHRSSWSSPWRKAAAAAAGGLAAWVALGATCPSSDPLHVAGAHGAIGAVLALGAILLPSGRRDRRREGPPPARRG